MRLNFRSPRQRQSGAADWLRYLLVVLIAVLALDLTRRFVNLYQRGRSRPAPVAVQPAESEPSNQVAFLPPATAEPLPVLRMTPAPDPEGDAPPAHGPAPSPGVPPPGSSNQLKAPAPARGGRPMPPAVANGPVQADYRLPAGVVPVTFFKPGAITPIAVPGDDGGGAGSP